MALNIFAAELFCKQDMAYLQQGASLADLCQPGVDQPIAETLNATMWQQYGHICGNSTATSVASVWPQLWLSYGHTQTRLSAQWGQ